MKDVVVLTKSAPNQYERMEQLVGDLRERIGDEAGYLSLAQVLGALEIMKFEMIQENDP